MVKEQSLCWNSYFERTMNHMDHFQRPTVGGNESFHFDT